MLRDREFCSPLHRKKYGDRLGKALHKIAAPDPAPAGIADFRVQMPVQQGNLTSTLILWQTVNRRNRIPTRAQWPLTIATSDPGPIPECVPDECPPPSGHWMAAPPAEPVAAFVQASAAPTPVYTLWAPRFAAELDLTPVLDKARHALAPYYNWMPAPAAEPVAAFVQAYAAPTPAHTLRAPLFPADLAPALVMDRVRHAPAPYYNWMPAPAPEPVTAFVHAYAAPAPARTLRAPRFAAELESTPVLDKARHAPAPYGNWIPAPAPEPVAAFVAASAALALEHTLHLPRFTVELEPAPFLDVALDPPAACGRWMPSPAPEPVAAFVQTSTALAAPTLTLPLRLPRFTAELEPARFLHMALCAPVAPPEPVAAFVQTAAALTPAHTPHTVRMTAPEFTAALEPLPVPDEPLEPPAMCSQWMRSPSADPVFSYLQASSAPAIAMPAGLKAPVFALPLAAPRLPWIARTQSAPQAEPVMAAEDPSSASEPLVPIRWAADIALPATPQVAPEWFETAGATFAASPEAVESWLVAAQATVPVPNERASCRVVELARTPAFLELAPAMGKPLPGPAPAALESLLVASVAAPISLAAVRMVPFALSAGHERAVPSFAAQRAAPPVASKPDGAAPRRLALQPIDTVAVAPPALARQPLDSALPRPGLLPIEFHTHRERAVPVERPEWVFPRVALAPPRFLLKPALEKLEDPIAQQRAARKEAEVIEIPNMPAAKRPTTVLMVFGRVAAGYILAASLWYGLANIRGDRRMATREVASADAAISVANNTPSAGMLHRSAPSQPAPKGTVAWVRHAIANRAALKIAEDFHGMENWESAAQAHPEGWSRHPDGYMNTGALALFHPTLKFTDYRMEFFGQIEAKSIGWTVRARDTRNYHAMKLTVVEAGIRPFVALVQYNVVDGISGHRTQTPLNVMVHNNEPMQFAVDVRGNRFVTSINGEEVDSFIDNTLVAGGVGFFSEAGEHARLYWMRVARNDDWLGHVCAMLAEETGMGSAAELRRPDLPGRESVPGLPADRDGATLAAVWIGLPYLGATRKTRFCKTWRSEPWNT